MLLRNVCDVLGLVSPTEVPEALDGACGLALEARRLGRRLCLPGLEEEYCLRVVGEQVVQFGFVLLAATQADTFGARFGGTFWRTQVGKHSSRRGAKM